MVEHNSFFPFVSMRKRGAPRLPATFGYDVRPTPDHSIPDIRGAIFLGTRKLRVGKRGCLGFGCKGLSGRTLVPSASASRAIPRVDRREGIWRIPIPPPPPPRESSPGVHDTSRQPSHPKPFAPPPPFRPQLRLERRLWHNHGTRD
jgi:hypothetical protein